MAAISWDGPVTIYMASQEYAFDAETWAEEHRGILQQLSAICYDYAENPMERRL